MHEPKLNLFVSAGAICLGLAIAAIGALPGALSSGSPLRTLDDLVKFGVSHEFVDLAERFPVRFGQHFPDGVTRASFSQALQTGRDIYVAEACWHCHSQQVRPQSTDIIRYGPVSTAREYHNVLQRPPLYGSRRVGPDLIREAGRRSNDWHMAHFFNPVDVSPTSVMPRYPWFFDDDGYPNKRGMSLITYVQWLGSWVSEDPYFEGKSP